MHGVARVFFLSSLLYGLAGLVLGNVMAATQDHGQLPTHAHTMVIGWVSFALFGLFYHQFPAAASGVLAKVHLAVAEASLVVLIAGLFIHYGGNDAIEPVLGAAAIIYALSFALFAFIAARAVSARR